MGARVAFVASLVALSSVACVDRPPEAPARNAETTRLLPARVRRLTNVELERTLSALVGAPVELAARLPPDVRQEDFTPNAEQGAPAQWATRLDAVAREIAATTARERLAELVPCAAKARDRACASELVTTLGRQAFRRPLDATEKAALLATFDAGANDGGQFSRGAELVLRALIESPNLLYLTELGEGGAPGDSVTLTPYEIASQLAYTVRGAPPDDELLAKAASGSLLKPSVREHEARRLLGMKDTRHHFRRFVLEWLEVDELERSAKSAALHPEYEALKSHMLAETSAFIDEVMVAEGASISALLTAGFASVDPPLARFYGLKTWGPRASLVNSGRIGILQQASFLAAHAHEDFTSPVKRGDFVMKKLLCSPTRRPAELGIDLVFPPPSTALTTRERFSQHVVDPSCASCHDAIDAFGFPFETFDAAGRARRTEHERPVNPVTQARVDGKTVRLGNSVELSRILAQSPNVKECFARQAFRYFSAQHDAGVERSYLELRDALSDERSGNLVEELVVYVASELFVKREVRSP
ncbi:MAG TPA: DUF1592 domain-containing protein [Polyangiaceae bacterium]|nr:DUF1592 domain-containing protein [Polyangiaceae bacterium]